MDSQAIAKWAEQKAAPAESPSYTRLTLDDHENIIKMHDAGMTLTAIAQQLGRSVSTIHDVVHAYRPTIDLAKRKLAASALRMAENVVENGQARDHIQALKGLKVLEADDRDIKIAVGVSLHGLGLESESAQKQAGN